MRVCIVAGTYHPEIGGPPRYLRSLGRELVAAGHQVRVLCMAPAGVRGLDDPFPVHRISRAWPVPLRLLLMVLAVLRWGRAADLILISDHGLAPAAANLLLRRPSVIRIVGDFAWEYSRRHGLTQQDIDAFQATRQRGRPRLVQMLQRFYVARCDRVLVPSRYLARIVQGWGIAPRRIQVIHNAVDPERYRLDLGADEARRRLGLPERCILTVARLAPWKGVDELIACLPALDPELTLVVVGEGPERAALERRAAELGVAARVQFRGAVPLHQVTVYLRGAEVFALFTGYEGLSHVLLEALLVGVPIVASRKGGNVEVIEDGKSGILVPYPDRAALTAALQLVTTDPELQVRLRRGARTRSERFHWDRLVQETLTLLARVARREPCR